MRNHEYRFTAIGTVHSPYREKFGIPRQSGLVNEAGSHIELYPPYNRVEAVRGMEQLSHIWVLFVFHQAMNEQWRPTVRPPRLGGNDRLGVFATRSPFRPNAIGLSSARLLDIDCRDKRVRLQVAGLDLVDGTPVLDIKPYISYTDSHADAEAGYAHTAPACMNVQWQDAALLVARQLEKKHSGFVSLVEQVLAQDPRPAYQEQEVNRLYGIRLYDSNIRWRVNGDAIEIIAVDEYAVD